jgi:thioredoxin reductase (NADPH)
MSKARQDQKTFPGSKDSTLCMYGGAIKPGQASRVSRVLDCLIVGGGPAGLTASVYLGRFRRDVRVVDGGWSRAEWITRSHNVPGFPEGIAGPVLLARLREQARLFGATLDHGYVESLRRDDDLFVATVDGVSVYARTIILSTGVVENKPPVPHLADAVKSGLIRTCPICDGYENIDKRIAVLGDGAHAAAEALFLRTYTPNLSLLLVDKTAALAPAALNALAAAGIVVGHVGLGAGAVRLENHGVTALVAEDGQAHRFDVVYSAFGTTSQTKLAASLDAKMDASGRLYVSEHQQTSVDGLYAAGDVVRGLNQISVANGEAAIAATAVHNHLTMVHGLQEHDSSTRPADGIVNAREALTTQHPR